jgi:DNA-binding NtrC family response regulator
MDEVADNSAPHRAEETHEAAPVAPRAHGRRRILIVTSDQLLARELKRNAASCGLDAALSADAGEPVDDPSQALVLDLASAQARHHLRQWRPATSVALLAVAALGGSTAGQEDAMASGAQLLPRPISRGAFAAALHRAFDEQRRKELLAYHPARAAPHGGLAQLIGESTPMLRLRARLRVWLDLQWAAAAQGGTRFVLLHGACGTGKSRVARALHCDGPRRGAGFVEFDARGLSNTAVEDRLFGSGPSTASAGLVRAAVGGTLFIREIADIAPPLQVRLIEAAAAHALLLLAGSRRSLQQLMTQGALAPPLAPLLAATAFALPPLRERTDDVCRLAQYFLCAEADRFGMAVPAWRGNIHAALLDQPWPGNLQELRQTMQRALLAQRDGMIDAGDIRRDEPPPHPCREPATDLEFARIEHETLRRALERSRGNVSKAARLLGKV